MTARWQPDIHDSILTRIHSYGCTDSEITGRMLDAGHAISQRDVGTARRRLKLKANTKPAIPEKTYDFKDKPNPLTEAKICLDSRLVEKPSGYFLDRVPVDLRRIMQAYNKIRLEKGLLQIDTNPAWRV